MVAAAAAVAVVAAVAAGEVPAAEVPPRTHGTKFFQKYENPLGTSGRASLISIRKFKTPASIQIQRVINSRTGSFCPVLVLPPTPCPTACSLRSSARNSCYQKVLNEVEHFIPAISCFDKQKWPRSCTDVVECYCAKWDKCRLQPNVSMRLKLINAAFGSGEIRI